MVLMVALVVSVRLPSPSAGPRSYDSAVLALHPVAFWDLSAGRRSERDLTGHGHTGRYVHALPSTVALPDGERAADFDGRGQYLSVRASPVFSISHTRTFTWEAWIRPDTLTFAGARDPHRVGYVDWMGKCESFADACEWEARMYSAINPQGRCSRLSAYAFNSTGGLGSGAYWQPACGTLHARSWLYVVGEYQTRETPSGCARSYPGTISIWVDAIEENFAAHQPTGCMSQYGIRPASGSSPLDIGTMARETWFPGAVGKVAIYDTLLPQAEIDRHYRMMTGTPPRGRCAASCTLAAG